MRRRPLQLLLCVLLCATTGCDESGGADAGMDAGRADAGRADAATTDAGDGDAGDGGAGASDAGEGDAAVTGTCAPDGTGLVAPLPECTADAPCTDMRGAMVTVPSEAPACPTPEFEVLSHEIAGTTRYACVRRAPDPSAGAAPLVLFFHGGGDGASTVTQTSLSEKSRASSLMGGRTGFTLLAVHGRRIRFGTAANRDGEYHHDFYYRDLASPSTNPDVANADAWIDRMVDEGIVDPNHIFVMGWSNGAFFGQLYAVARHETATPGGARVRAAAVFSAGDPFHGIDANPFDDPMFDPATDGGDCQLSVYPSSDVPILLVYRTCDLTVPCGDADRACWGENRGFSVDRWRTTAATASITGLVPFAIHGVEPEAGGAQDSNATMCSNIATRCTTEPTPAPAMCFSSAAAQATAYCQCLVNHLRWPDGDYPMGTQDREPGMLLFLRDSAPL